MKVALPLSFRVPMRPVMRRVDSRPVAVSAMGVAGALAVHALLVALFVLDLSLPARHPHDWGGVGAAARFSAEPAEMTVVFIDDPATATRPETELPASHGLASPDVQAVVLSPDSAPAGDIDAVKDLTQTQDSSATASDSQRALLYGRYLGQTHARIERAWLRPRSSIGAPTFSCQTRIKQDRLGAVIEVRLDHCNGTALWQQSLVSAIRTASPLPAPPDASVYADVLWLSFSSEGFGEGGSTQGFEPEIRTANAAERSVLESFQRFASGALGDHESRDNAANVIHLTIIGSPADRSAPAPSEGPSEPPAAPAPEPQTPELFPR